MNRADSDDGRSERDIELPAGNRLQRQHDLRSDDDRIDAEPRICAVCLLAVNFDTKRIDGGKLRARTIRNLTDGISRGHV